MEKRERYFTGEKSLTPEEVERLLLHIDNLMHEGLIKLAIAGGLRRDDVIRVRQKDIDPNEMTVTFYERKKRRIKTVYVSADTMKTLMQIKKEHPTEDYIFYGRSEAKHGKGHLSSKQAYNVLQTYLERAGLDKRPFHSLRATCIKLCQARGWSQEKTAKHVGDLVSTIQQHYLTPSQAEMRDVAMEKPII